jgi:hypothetical protein
MRMAALLLVVALTLHSEPAAAQSATNDAAPIDGFPLPLDVSPPADTEKPRFFVPPPLTAPPGGCAAAFDCRVQVIGAIQRNGAIVLNATALKW